jgi:NAD(P)-dependent dehydrogenase (short-subunit alcohol dehydrogenase family)
MSDTEQQRKVWFITGASSGFGREIVDEVLRRGDRVVAAVRKPASVGDLAGRDDVLVVKLDVTKGGEIAEGVQAALGRFGQIDVLVNNAALYAPLHEQKFTEIDVALWDKVMAVNLRGTFLVSKHVALRMIERKYGKIINVGSGTPVRGIPWLMHYVASKGGIMAMTRSMSRELGEDGICVNTLMPGFTLSDSIVNENPGHVETARGRAIASRAIKRDMHPQDLLGALVFLASAESDFVTGQTIAVDGGNVNT